MPVFEFSSRFPCPVEKLWAFHERPDAFQLLTPTWAPVRLERESGGLAVGARKEIRIGIWPFQVRWLALHRECRPGERFADEQIEGPFRRWYHEHIFAADGSGSRLTDRVDYECPRWPLIDVFIRWQLRRMFEYRHRVTRQFTGTPD